jgi:hypothetical protein
MKLFKKISSGLKESMQREQAVRTMATPPVITVKTIWSISFWREGMLGSS